MVGKARPSEARVPGRVEGCLRRTRRTLRVTTILADESAARGHLRSSAEANQCSGARTGTYFVCASASYKRVLVNITCHFQREGEKPYQRDQGYMMLMFHHSSEHPPACRLRRRVGWGREAGGERRTASNMVARDSCSRAPCRGPPDTRGGASYDATNADDSL